MTASSGASKSSWTLLHWIPIDHQSGAQDSAFKILEDQLDCKRTQLSGALSYFHPKELKTERMLSRGIISLNVPSLATHQIWSCGPYGDDKPIGPRTLATQTSTSTFLDDPGTLFDRAGFYAKLKTGTVSVTMFSSPHDPRFSCMYINPCKWKLATPELYLNQAPGTEIPASDLDPNGILVLSLTGGSLEDIRQDFRIDYSNPVEALEKLACKNWAAVDLMIKKNPTFPTFSNSNVGQAGPNSQIEPTEEWSIPNLIKIMALL